MLAKYAPPILYSLSLEIVERVFYNGGHTDKNRGGAIHMTIEERILEFRNLEKEIDSNYLLTCLLALRDNAYSEVPLPASEEKET